jgi:hypothetical protein
MLALEKERMWDNFQRIIEHFTQKIVKIWSWDPGSGRRNKPIPDPGVKKAPDPGAVLSLTVDKVIQSSLFQAPALSRDGSRAGSNSQQYRQHSRQVRFFFAPRKELGKGGGEWNQGTSVLSVGTSVPQLDAGSGSRISDLYFESILTIFFVKS